MPEETRGNARIQRRSTGGGRFVFDVFENGAKVATGLPKSSVNGNPRGGTFDSSAESYSGPPSNDQTGNRNIIDDNVDKVPRGDPYDPATGGGNGGGGTGDFSEQELNICVNGELETKVFLTKDP